MLRAAARPFHPLVGGAPCSALTRGRCCAVATTAAGPQGRLGGGRAQEAVLVPACSSGSTRPLLSRGNGVAPLRHLRCLPPCSSAAARRWKSSKPKRKRHDAESSSAGSTDEDSDFAEDDALQVVNPGLAGTVEELNLWAARAEVLVHIHSSPSSTPFELSEMKVPGEQPPEAPPGWAVRLTSAAGMKSAGVPNQDAFSYTQMVGGWMLCIVCDGHGEQGEVISERVARTLPLLLARHLEASMEVEEALHRAFLEAQLDLESNFMTTQVYAGTTVAACCLNFERRQTWFAHAGDSRLVLGDLATGEVAYSTEEHKAHDPAENVRLQAAGAQVIEKRYAEGEVISRVFIPRTGVPGLAMSRSLGDGCLKSYGVIAVPEVHEVSSFWKQCKEPIIVAASDGLWDTISVEEAMHALAGRRASQLDVRLGSEVLCRRAQRLWIEEEENYCDDATVLIMAPGQPEPIVEGV